MGIHSRLRGARTATQASPIESAEPFMRINTYQPLLGLELSSSKQWLDPCEHKRLRTSEPYSEEEGDKKTGTTAAQDVMRNSG